MSDCAAIADKDYDSKANRTACRVRGIVPIIPHRSNAKDRPKFFPKLPQKTRARIEQTKEAEAFQTRCYVMQKDADEF